MATQTTRSNRATPRTQFYATVGATDLAVETVREAVAEVQTRVRGYRADVSKSVSSIDLQPKALRHQAVTVVSARVDALAKDVKAVPARVQSLVDDNVSAVGEAYGDLVKRGESLVGRIRRQQSTQQTVASAETTVAKAKTTRTQATKAATTTRKTAKKATRTTGRTAKKQSGPSRSSAKATVTSARKTATSATKAVADAAQKVGD